MALCMRLISEFCALCPLEGLFPFRQAPALEVDGTMYATYIRILCIVSSRGPLPISPGPSPGGRWHYVCAVKLPGEVGRQRSRWARDILFPVCAKCGFTMFLYLLFCFCYCYCHYFSCHCHCHYSYSYYRNCHFHSCYYSDRKASSLGFVSRLFSHA